MESLRLRYSVVRSVTFVFLRNSDNTHAYEHSLSIDFFAEQLLRRQLLDEDIIQNRKEAPDSSVGSGRDIEARILQRLGVLVDQTIEDG